MRLSNVRKAACLRAIFLLNKTKPKKTFNLIHSELLKLSEIFGVEFDKEIFANIFDEIDFKDYKSIQSDRNNSSKIQYFFCEFIKFMEKSEFINSFSQILMNTTNKSSAKEIFENMVKLLELSYENQFKIIISFIYSMNDKYQEDIENIFISKCTELHNEGKVDQLSKSMVDNITLIVHSNDVLKNDNFLTNTFISFLINTQNISEDLDFEYKSTDPSKLKQIEEFEKFMNNVQDESIEYEKILQDLGPFINNNLIPLKSDLIDYKIDEKRLARFILFLCKNQTWNEDKENRHLNKIFLKSLNNDLTISIDENNEKKNVTTWNVENFYSSIQKEIDVMDMNLLFHNFDDPSFSIKDKKTFEFFLNLLKQLKIPDIQTNIMNLIFSLWENDLNQIEFIEFLINLNQPELFSFKNCQRKVKKNFEILVQTNKNNFNFFIEAWSSIDLIEVLLKISRKNNYAKVKDLFIWPIENIPEIIVIGLSIIKTEGDEFLFDEIINETLPLFLGNHINSIVVLEEVWNLNRDLVIKTICNLYNSNPDLMNLSRILDITQKLKDSLIPIVSCNDHNFTVNLAILAVKRDFLHIDQWLSERISKIGDDFIESLLNYIKDNVISLCKDVTSQTAKENILERCQLSLESLAIIFENLTPNKIGKYQNVSKRIEAEITNTYKAIFEIFDELQAQPPNSEEIEEAANKMYQNLFHSEATINEIIDKMKSYRNSQNQKESEIYACMIHSLLDEYRFFYQYPERELTIIATLFGQIINQKLLDGIIETIALKYVIEGIKKGTGNMFLFAVIALEQFADKLNQWPQYLNSLIIIPTLKNNQFIYEKVTSKFNELNNTKKPKDVGQNEGRNHYQFNNLSEDKRSNKDLSQVSKMPVFPFDEFNRNFKTISSNEKPVIGSVPPYMMQQAGYVQHGYYQQQQGQTAGKSDLEGIHFNSIQQVNPAEINNVLINGNVGSGYHQNIGEIDKEDDFSNFNNKYISMNKEELKNLKQDLLNVSGNSKGQSFTSNGIDKNIQNNQNYQARPKLSNINNSHSNNITQILGSVEYENTFANPPQEVVEKIKFIFNTMSKNNIADKSNELKLILSNESYVKWFSNFFIVNRVSAENNNHIIYNDLIAFIDSKELNYLLIKDTIIFIKKLLNSEKIAKETKEKNILKNLGNWLGILTLAKNRPILAKDLDLKELLFDAYENGRLGPIVTFVCKILEHSIKTKVFHPKNPWVQALLSVLAELYHRPNLKNTLKFEIDNIFKKFDLDLLIYPQTRILEGIIYIKDSPDFLRSSIENQASEINTGEIFRSISSGCIDNYANDLLNLISRNSNSIAKHDVYTILTNALANAIHEIISPVVERAVNISLVTTRELIQKDFAFEKDDVKYKNAANLCIKSLAGSLAMVTCREPLRIGFNNQLKEIIGKKGLEIENILEPIYNSPNNIEILDIGCNYIQNFVIKRAIEKIEKDKTILEELDKRKKQKSIEVKAELINKIKLLPESLRPSINGLTNEQFKIYEDFDKVYEKNKKEHQNKKLSFLKLILPAIKECLESYTPNQPFTKMINKYEICMFNVQFICKQNEPLEFSDSEDDEHLSSLSKLIFEFKVSESIGYELVLVTLKYVINFAKVSSMNLINIYSEILRGWVKLYPNFAKEITMKILNFDDVSTRYKFEIHYHFFKKGIFDIEEYENFIKKNLEDYPQYNYLQKLLNSLCEKNVINNHTFSKIPFYMISPKLSNNYYELFHKKIIFNNSNNKDISLTDYKVCNIRDNNSYNAFKEMCKMTIRQLTNLVFSINNPQNIKTTMKQFIESSIVKSDEQMNAFMMLFTEFSVKSCLNYNPDNIAFPESQAKTILILLNNITSPNKLKYFENILYGIFKIFHIDYLKNGLNFNQKPYFKIFFNLIHLIYTSDPQDEIFNNTKKYQFFFVILDFLRILKPQNYPAFANAWLELISCKYFSSIFLDVLDVKSTKEIYVKNEKYILLIIDLMNYLKSFNNENINSIGVKIFIENVFKFLFLLSNTYPDYLSNYYYIIIASLPPGDYFLQLKNIILSSTPSDIEQPDPFYDEFKVDSLPEIKKNAVISFDIVAILNDYQYKQLIDEFIDTKNEFIFEEIINKLNKKDKDNVQNNLVINAIVIYWSQYIIKTINEKRKMNNQEVLEFFTKMMRFLEVENRDHLINSILNELRYPSNQTYYFSCLLLCIFCEVKNDQIEEHILRNILQRLLYKPYPWGILVTFIELYRFPKYELFKKPFIHNCEKTIEELMKFMKSSKLNKNLDNYIP